MATNKNFEVKNGLTIAGTERISSAGVITGSLAGSIASATTATTQSAADNSTKIATTAYTDAAITALIGGAPSALNDLNELAAAIADDANYSTTITTALATKAPLASPSFTGNADVAGELYVGNQNSLFAENVLRFNPAGSSYIDHTTTGQSIRFRVSNSSALDTTAITILGSGNVGIGTTGPTAKLHVAGTIKGTDLIAHDSGGLAFQTDEGTKRVSILDSGNVVIGDNSLIGNNPTGSALNIFGDGVTLRFDGSGNSTKTILFRGTSAGNPGEVYADGGLRLRTEDANMPIMFHTNSTGSNNERMRIAGDGSTRFRTGAGFSTTTADGTGSVSISNSDLDSVDQLYESRIGRYLISNGTGWGTPDGRNPGLVIHSDSNATNDRAWPGLMLHNENNTTNAYGPFIGWGAKSESGSFNTAYAFITGKPTGTGNDANWRAGEMELYTVAPGTYLNTKPGIRITSAGLVQQPKLYDSNGFFWLRGTNSASGQTGITAVIWTTRAQAGSGNTSLTTGRYTTPVEGVYHFSTNVRIDQASSASTYFRIAFYTGTSPATSQTAYGQGHSIYGPGSYSTSYFSMQTSWSVYLAAGTQVGVAVQMDSGSYTIHTESQFSGHLVG